MRLEEEDDQRRMSGPAETPCEDGLVNVPVRPEAVERILRDVVRGSHGGADERQDRGDAKPHQEWRRILSTALEGLMARKDGESRPAKLPLEELAPLQSIPAHATRSSEGGSSCCLGCLDSDIRGMVPNCSNLEKKLLESLVDYIGFSARLLQGSSRTESLGGVDVAVCNLLRGKVLPVFKEFITARQQDDDGALSPDVCELTRGVEEALKHSSKVEDVSGKRKALAQLWERCISTMRQLQTRTDIVASQKVHEDRNMFEAARSETRKLYHEGVSILGGQEVELHRFQQEVDSELRRREEALKKAHARVQEERSQQKVTEEGYHQELWSILDELAPRMKGLKDKYLRMQDKREEASCAMVGWSNMRTHNEELKTTVIPRLINEIKDACDSIQAARDALKSCNEGISHTFEIMENVQAEEQAVTRARAERLHEASAKTYDLVWSSLLQSKTRNSENLRELAADRERIKDGLSAALDRLDAAEEMQLKEELKRLDARVAQAEADNATIEENLSHLDGASKELLDALHSGKAGRPLTVAEKQLYGVQAKSWAFKIGECIVRDRKVDEEAMAMKYRQQRLDQLRKSHQREFERIQHLKQQLQTDALCQAAKQLQDENLGSSLAGRPDHFFDDASQDDAFQGKHLRESAVAEFGTDAANKRRRA